MRFVFCAILFTFLILSVDGLTVDNVFIFNPPCSGGLGSINITVGNVIGTLNTIWIPAIYSGTYLFNLPSGTYSVNISDDVNSYTNAWIITIPTPILIVNNGTYWNTFGNWYKNLTEYVALSCTNTNNPNYIGYPGGYGRWNVTKEFGKIVNGGTPPYNWLWSSPYGTFDDPTIPYPYFYPDTPMVLFNLTLTLTDSNSCQAISVIPFVLQQLNPVIVIEPATIGQSDGSLIVSYEGRHELSNFYFTNVGGSTVYLPSNSIYSTGGNFLTDQNNVSFLGIMSTGNYRISYDYSLGKCNSSLYFTIGNKLTFSVGLSDFITSNDTITLTSDGTPPFTYLWTTSYGLIDPTSLNPGFVADYPINYQLRITDSNGAIGILTTQFNPLKIQNIITPISYCQSYTPSLSLNFGLPPYIYYWSPSNLVSEASLLNPMFTVPLGFNGILTLSVVDATGFLINQDFEVSRYDLSIDSYEIVKLCISPTGSIINIVINGDDNTCWSLNLGVDVIANGIGTTVSDIHDLIPGNYTFTLSCSDCDDFSQNIVISDGNDPVSILTTQIDNYCAPFDILINGTTTSYQWTTSDPTVNFVSSNTLIPQIQTESSSTILTLTAFTGKCSVIQDIEFYISPPQIYLEIQNNTCLTSVALNGVLNDLCLWSDSLYQSCSRSQLSTGSYFVTYNDQCRLTHTIQFSIFSNCTDLCPLDPLKILPGQCGCGIPDIDQDLDGVSECLDLCDTNYHTIESCPEETQIVVSKYNATILQGEVDVELNLNDGLVVIVSQKPLVEIDQNGNELQSLDLQSVHWDNTLTKYEGYHLLISKGDGFVGEHNVKLVWYQYFSYNFSFVQNTTLLPGDSKIAFEVHHWPFLNYNNSLRAQLDYNLTVDIIKEVKVSQTPVSEIHQYLTDSNLILQTVYLKIATLDGIHRQIKLNFGKLGSVQIIFPFFTDILTYDPLMSFLFTESLNNNNWLNFQGTIIAGGVALIIVISFIAIYQTNLGFKYLAGPEAYRVKNLRNYTSDNADEIEKNDNASRSREGSFQTP